MNSSLKKEEELKKQKQVQQEAKEAANEKRVQEQELREIRTEKKEDHWWKVGTWRYWLLAVFAAVQIALMLHNCNRSDSNTKEPVHKVEPTQEDVHSIPLPTSLDTSVSDSMRTIEKADSVPFDSVMNVRLKDEN